MTRSLLSPGAQTSLRQRVTCYLPRCVLGPVCPAGRPPHFRRYHQWVLISHRLLFCRWSHEIKLHSQGCLVFDDTGWSQWPQTLGGVPGSLGLGTSRLPREAAFLWHLEVNWLRGRKVGGEGDFSDWEPRPVFGSPTAQRCWLVAGGMGGAGPTRRALPWKLTGRFWVCRKKYTPGFRVLYFGCFVTVAFLKKLC